MTRLDTEHFVAPMLSGGLDAAEARKIAKRATEGQTELDHESKRRLIKLSETYASFFTREGAAEWKALTGIDVRGGKVEYPEDFLPKQSLLKLRASTTTSVAKINKTYEVKRTGKSVEVSLRGQTSRAAAPAPKPSAVSTAWVDKTKDADIRTLRPPTAFLDKFVAERGSPVIKELFDEIAHLEATEGDNNGTLVPRDLANASPTIKALMQRVFAKEGGAKAIPLSRVERRVNELATSFLNGRYGARADAKDELYPRLVRGALAWIAEGYHREVIGGNKLSGEFFRGLGFDSRSAARMRRTFPQAFPKPTPEEAARLWRMKLDGQLTSPGFVEIAQRGVAEGAKLEKQFPKLFAKGDDGPSAALSFFGSAANAAQDFSKLVAKYTKEDILIGRAEIIERANRETDFVKKWGKSTEARYKTWQRNQPDLFPDLRAVSRWVPVLTAEIKVALSKNPGMTRAQVLAALKPRHPGISKSHIEKVSSAAPGLFTVGKKAGGFDRDAQVGPLGELATRLAKRDILISRDEIVRQFNADPKLVAEFGKIKISTYTNVSRKNPKLFPKLRDRSVWVPIIKADVKKLLEKKPTLTYAEVAEELKAKHPSINSSRISELAKLDKKLFAPKRQLTKSERTYDAKLARAVKLILEKQPKTSATEIAQRLAPKYPWLTPRGVLHLIDKLIKPEVPRSIINTAERDPARSSQVVQGIYDLTLRLFPPGTKQDIILAAVNQELEKRGMPGFEGKNYQAKRGSSVDVQAKVAAGILAEYAKAAPKGASEREIFDRIEADYPTLTPLALRPLRAAWDANPKEYPELTPFRTGKKLELEGLGRKVEEPRYIGGWTVERAILGGDKAELSELAEMTQHTRIPLRLPMLDAILDDLKGTRPLATKNVLMVSHFLATSVPLALALRKAGAELDSTVMVGTPYGSNRTVVDTLTQMGFDLRVPTLSVADYRKAVEKGLDDVVAKHRKNGQSVVVLDDGGLVADLLHANAKYADVRGAFKLVEQTTGGVIVSEKHALETPIINAARSKSKMREAPFIGEAVATKVRQGLERIGKKIAGQKAVVIGFGTVGKQLAKQLREAGAKVVVIEPSETRRAAAKDAGFAVSDSVKKHLSNSDLLVGCTGTQTLSLEDMKHLKSGATIASASSKQTEFQMDALKRAASKKQKIEPDVSTVTLPSYEYTLGRKQLTVLGDGWPVNFDGDVEDIDAEDIQLTRAIMFSGALQASKLLNTESRAGLVPYDEKEDLKILRRFEKLQKKPAGAEGLRDPSRWTEVVAAMATRLGALEVEGSAASKQRAKAKFLIPLVNEWFKEDPFMKREDVVARANEHPEFVERFGKLTQVQFGNLQSEPGFPKLRNGSAWMAIVLEDVKAIMKKNPDFQRKDLLAELSEKYPRITKSNVDTLGAKFPKIVPNRNA
ncbi:MAG: NAD-binding protein [Deltaproteobacteria bacterium]|nr:NAD-binding protein [Deltaproteobacteria bacterium]